MRKITYLKTMLLAVILLVGSASAWGQLLQWNTFGNLGTETTEPSVFNDANIAAAYLTQGTITAAANGNRFGGSGWFNTGNTVAGNTLTEAIAGNDYIQFIVIPNAGYSFTPTSFVFQWQSSSSGPKSVTLRSSADNYNSDIATSTVTASIATYTMTISGLNSITTSTTFRLYGYGSTATTGTGGFDVASSVVDVQLNGTTASTGSFIPPTLTADATNNDVDNNIDIPFTDDATWRGLITAVKVGGTALTGADYVLSSGNLQLKPSGLNPLLTTSGSKAVTIEATGYSTASITQQINAGAAAKLGMKTQPAAPAANGGALATQPAVYIQDQYGNTTTSTANVTAAVGAGSWTLGGTPTVAAVAGTATFSGLTATSAAAVTGATIGFTSGLLTAATSGTFDIPVPAPTITVSPTTLTGFTYAQGAGPSTEKIVTVSGLNLTNNISIAAATDYEISTGTGGTFVATNTITLTQSGGTVGSTTIYVRLKAGLPLGTYNSEIINVTSTGATAATVTCSGTVTAPPTPLPFVENFDYANGQLLTDHGWTAHSSAGTQAIDVTVPGLSFNGYVGSGIGGAARVDNNGEDVNKTFTPQTSGSIYAAFIISASSTNSSGYFFHLAQDDIAYTTYVGRVWINATGTSVGIGTGSSVAISANTPTLLVVKYNIDTKLSSLYVLNTMSATEPVIADATYQETLTLSNIGAICLRQYSATQNILVDGITVTTTWSDLPVTFSGTGDWTVIGRWNTGVVPDATANVVVDGDATISTNVQVAGLTLNASKSLTVNAGKQLTVSTTLTNKGTLNLLSTASGTATILTPATIGGSGTASVQQYLSSARNWYVSSPVTNATAPAGYTYYNYNEAGSIWGGSVTSFTKGVGYIALPDLAGSTLTFTTQPGGTLNTGNVDITLTKSGPTKTGFNLIGNPYPAHLTWTKTFVNNNSTRIEPTIWYRTNAGTVNSGGNASWSFLTYNAVSEEGTPTTANGIVPPMQAFWVRAVSAGTSTLTLNSDLTLSHQASNPLKAPAVKSSDRQRLRLQVNNGTSTDETLIYFDANASNGYDRYDSPKFEDATTVTQIYTTAGTEKLVINGMNSIPLDTEIGLGFVPGNATSFSIMANEISNLPSDVKVILKDNVTLAETDLTNGVTTYEFSPATTTTNRFSVIFRTAGAVTGIPTAANEQNLLVYRNANNQIAVQIKGQLNDSYSLDVYNSVGQKLASKQATAGITIMDAPQSGVYFVTIKGNGNNTTKKVVIN